MGSPHLPIHRLMDPPHLTLFQANHPRLISIWIPGHVGLPEEAARLKRITIKTHPPVSDHKNHF